MLSFIFMLLFLIPLIFLKSNSWLLVQLLFFVFSFLFMIEVNLGYGFESISYSFGYDLMSYGLILLSFWICSLMILASSSIYNSGYFSNIFMFMVVFLMLMLILTFCSLNMMMFYLFFESSLIPTLLLILGWGYQPERIQAGVYFLFYTLLASLPLLISLLNFYSNYDTLSFFFSDGMEFNSMYMYMCMMMAFLVKMPMFLVHLWLPSAHVEAPISGSMILAGVLLKLGGYGLMRVMKVLVLSCLKFNYFWVSVSLVGGFLVSLVCLRQMDMKALVAYSSVVHMGMVLSGMLTLNYWGFCGAYLMMVGHGLCSSGMFCLSNISYERIGSRSMMICSGLLSLMPNLTLWWFLLSSSNMAAPPSLNLLGEISLINSLMAWSVESMLGIMMVSFFGAAYSLYIYSYSQHGKMFSGIYAHMSGLNREYLLLFLHWVPLNLLILSGEIFYIWL